jgi:hypothetical protein
MNKREMARKLMARQIACRPDGYPTTSPLKNLLELGFCELKDGYFRATAATPLAMLYRTDIDSAERLAREGLVYHGDASKPVKVSMARLVNKGLATRGDCEWMPTEKLLAAVKCWHEAKGSGRGMARNDTRAARC